MAELNPRRAVFTTLFRLARAWAWRVLWPAWATTGFYAALCLLNLGGGGAQALWLCGMIWAFVRGAQTPLPLPLPRPRAAARAVEAESGLAHRPLDTLEDTAACGDPALWARHQSTVRASLKSLKSGFARSDIAALDPFALRHAAFLALLVSAVIAGPEAPARLRAGLEVRRPAFAAAAPQTADIWIEPPAYTRRAPVHLISSSEQPRVSQETVAVPEGSLLKVRVGGPGRPPRLRYAGHPVALPGDAQDGYTTDLPLQRSGTLRLRRDVRDLGAWPIAVVRDARPVIALKETAATPEETLKITYMATDDYGLARVSAIVLPRNGEDAEALTFPLSTQGGETAQTLDLSADPRAGEAVRLVLSATDAMGQTSATAPADITLPERTFKNPLSRRLAAIRAALKTAEAPESFAPEILSLAQDPGLYGHDSTAYLALRAAARRLQQQSPALLAEVRDLLWRVAVRLDTDPLSDAAQNLSAALRDLASTLGRAGIKQSEIDAKMDAARARLQAYLRELAADMARRMRESGAAANLPPDILRRHMQQLNLDQMLKELESLKGKSGEDALRRAAEMLNRGRMTQFQESQTRAFQALADLEALAAEQEDLAARTAARKNLVPADTEDQDKLSKRLDETVKNLNMPTPPKSLSEAKDAMESASKNLRAEKKNEAAGQQKQAAQALRRGADGAAKTMAASMKQVLLSFGVSGGPNGAPGEGEDPLGRHAGDGGGQGETDLPSGAERLRLRDVLDDVRRRAQDRERPRLERDYLDRLLNP